MANTQSKLPDLDEKHFLRIKKTAWLAYLDAIAAFLWKENKGEARWTLNVDDGLRQSFSSCLAFGP